jgi:parallel beta-helix repeat protein
MKVQGAGAVVRGIGFQRYAPSVKDMGVVTAQVANVTLENLTVLDSATTGVYVWGTDDVLKNLTVARSGFLGVGANGAYGLRASGLLVADNNSEHFKAAPVSGGMKITRSRDIAVTDSAFLRNVSNGLWLDESVYQAQITGNDLINNGNTGILAELSAKVTIADNVVVGSPSKGIMIYDTADSQVWNNTMVNNGRNLSIMQDQRRGTQTSTAGHDPKRPNPDPTLTWVVSNISIHNNVLANATSIGQLTVEDNTKTLSATQMKLDINGNLYNRTNASQPARTAVWPITATSMKSYNTVTDFANATGQDKKSKGVDGSAALNSAYQLSSTLQGQAGAIAQALPSSLASQVGTTSVHLGAWW